MMGFLGWSVHLDMSRGFLSTAEDVEKRLEHSRVLGSRRVCALVVEW
jgi:hypothetical protein